MEAAVLPVSPASSYNGAVATAPIIAHGGQAPVVPMGGLRAMIREMLQQELGSILREEIHLALTGATAPHFPLPTSPSGRIINAQKQCSVTGCGRPVRSKNKCSAHYQKERREASSSEETTGEKRVAKAAKVATARRKR